LDDGTVTNKQQALIDHSSLIIKINPNHQDLGEVIDMNEFTRLTQGRFGSSHRIDGEYSPSTHQVLRGTNTKELSENFQK
jgi:hypothetical protein